MQSAWIVPALLMVTLVAQALAPQLRLLLVLSGAALCALVCATTGLATTAQLLADVPWGVLVILVGLGLLAELLAEARALGVLAVYAAQLSRGAPGRTRVAFAVGMYLVSGLVNNLTALVLVLPVLLALLRASDPSPRSLRWTLGLLLVACNLGGAATPIGDFPAILLLSRGSMAFGDYLQRALPATLLALALLIAAVTALVRPERDIAPNPLGRRLALRLTEALHRNARLDYAAFVPAALSLAAMLATWTFAPAAWHLDPALVCWIGVCVALLARGVRGERIARTRVDVEAALFLLGLFVMVAAARRAGVFEALGRFVLALPLAPRGRLVVFLAGAGLVTGVFSAGPGMASLLDVAATLAQTLPPGAVYVGLALSVCAGSSLFLTAATAGPLAQSMVERADLRDRDDRPLRFGFRDFLPVGVVSFALIEAIALGYALFTTRR